MKHLFIDITDPAQTWLKCTDAEIAEGWRSYTPVEVPLPDGSCLRARIARTVAYNAAPWLLRVYAIWDARIATEGVETPMPLKQKHKQLRLKGLREVGVNKFVSLTKPIVKENEETAI